MYSKDRYHDLHYSERSSAEYIVSVGRLQGYARPGSRLLDYGCGLGHFLMAAAEAGFRSSGAEFNAETAAHASAFSKMNVFPVSDLVVHKGEAGFDIIHLGDVLEHLIDPRASLMQLVSCLAPEGILYVEGPLEKNPSPVYWASLVFGIFRRLLRGDRVGSGIPQHLFRTDAKQQLAFFSNVAPELQLLHWKVYETGWPYLNGGLIKSLIARLAILIGGIKVGTVTFGNRFSAIFVLRPR